jgi:hypothetical protein
MVSIERKTTIAKGFFSDKRKREKFNSEKFFLAEIDNSERTHTLTPSTYFRYYNLFAVKNFAACAFLQKIFRSKSFRLFFSFADFYSLKKAFADLPPYPKWLSCSPMYI